MKGVRPNRSQSVFAQYGVEMHSRRGGDLIPAIAATGRGDRHRIPAWLCRNSAVRVARTPDVQFGKVVPDNRATPDFSAAALLDRVALAAAGRLDDVSGGVSGPVSDCRDAGRAAAAENRAAARPPCVGTFALADVAPGTAGAGSGTGGAGSAAVSGAAGTLTSVSVAVSTF